MPVYSATQLLEKSIITCRGEPVGTATACDPKPAAPSYEECFVRDFVLSVMWWVFLLRAYVRIYYWMGRDRLNEIHRYHSEEFGPDARSVLNVYPESISDWTGGGLKPGTGYLVGNVGPSRVDFCLFAMGNLPAILMGLAGEGEAQAIMRLYHHRWDQLVREMPLKIFYPAVEDKEWQFMTGSDPKNAFWSCHNGGNRPVLLWPFIGAARRTGRMDLAEHAFFEMGKRLAKGHWPEYYAGRLGSLIGRRANFNQVWSAAAYQISHELMENPAAGELFDRMCHEQQP